MKLLDKLGREIKQTEIDLGRVEVGNKATYEFYIYNENSSFVEDIKVKLENVTDKDEITILKAPKELKAGEKSLFKIEWSPSLKLKKGLKIGIKITGLEVYNP